MINGTVDIANASRKMKQKEIELAKSKGINPVEWVVGFDALAVYVHPENPIESNTISIGLPVSFAFFSANSCARFSRLAFAIADILV